MGATIAVESASVRLTISIEAETADIAESIEDTMEVAFESPEAASMFLGGGVVVEEIEDIGIYEDPAGQKKDEEEDLTIIIAAAAGGGAGACLLFLLLWWCCCRSSQKPAPK